MTSEGLAALLAEIERLETEERPAMAEQIKTARGFGDLKENAEYHAAKEASGHLETKILKLRDQVANAEIVEVASGDVVGLGSSVEVEDEQTGKTMSYSIVSVHEAVPSEGRLSIESPVGAALRGRRAGDNAVVPTPRGERRFKVLSVA
jgi:transcription elongation factor GreA